MFISPLKDFFIRYKEIEAEETYAVAVSGGPDSMALAHLMIQWGRKHHKKLHLLTVDHGLRKEAKTEAKMIADWVASLGIDSVRHSILNWEGDKPDTAIMETARDARYKLMADYCQQHSIRSLFIAHHQDDQAETFLIRLSKGSGLDGLAAMNALRQYNENVTLIRPLLSVSKQALISYCEEHHIPTVRDPSNENMQYMRPRLRASMEVLEAEGLTHKRLATTAKRLARARSALEEITEKTFDDCLVEQADAKMIFDFTSLREQPEEIGLRVIQKALEDTRPNAAYRARMEKLEELFQVLWFTPDNFKPRTLGGCIFSLKRDKQSKNKSLWLEREQPKEQSKEKS